MKDAMNENKTLVLLLSILAVVILGALYYYIVLPKIEHEKNIANSIQSLTTETRQLEQKVLSLSQEEDAQENTFELRKKLPATRAVSSLLLSLQEAELLSKAKIQSIAFNNYDGLVSESGYGRTEEEEEEVEEEIDQEDDVEIDESEEEVPETKIDVTTLPDALKLLSFSIQVEVQDYDHLLIFIREIEAIERVKRIEDIQFNQQGEEELTKKEPDESMFVTLQITTFYSEEEAK